MPPGPYNTTKDDSGCPRGLDGESKAPLDVCFQATQS